MAWCLVKHRDNFTIYLTLLCCTLHTSSCVIKYLRSTSYSATRGIVL